MNKNTLRKAHTDTQVFIFLHVGQIKTSDVSGFFLLYFEIWMCCTFIFLGIDSPDRAEKPTVEAQHFRSQKPMNHDCEPGEYFLHFSLLTKRISPSVSSLNHDAQKVWNICRELNFRRHSTMAVFLDFQKWTLIWSQFCTGTSYPVQQFILVFLNELFEKQC